MVHQGTTIVDTTEALHVWEHSHFPSYYVPLSGMVNCEWTDTGDIICASGKGHIRGLCASLITIVVSSHNGLTGYKTDRAVRFYREKNAGGAPDTAKLPSAPSLDGYVRLEFSSMGMAI